MNRFLLFLTIDQVESELTNNIIRSLQKHKETLSKEISRFELDLLQVSSVNNKNETEWKVLNDFNCQEEIKHLSCNENDVAEKIHLLANSLPTPGTYTIDVIWIWNTENKFLISDRLELFGALKRLVVWHNAFIYIVDELKTEESSEWAEMLEGEIISPSLLIENFWPWLNFWRGNITLRRNDSQGNDVMCGFHLIHDENNDLDDEEFKDVKSMTSSMSVVSECNASSIPNYLISDKIFTLCVKSRSGLIQNSSEWLQKFNSKLDIALIIRLEYSTQVFDYNVNPNTENWMKIITNGKTPDYLSPTTKNGRHFCFVAVSDSSGLPRIKVYLIRKPNVNLGYVYSLLQYSNPGLSTEEENSVLMTKLQNLNMYDSEWIFQALKILQEFEFDFRDQQQKINSESMKLMFTFRKNILDSLFSRKIPSSTDVISENKMASLFVPEYLIDENDWPERLSLIQLELERKNSQIKTNVLSELHPTTHKLVGDCNYILTCFQDDGKAKPKRQMAPLISNNDTHQCPMRTRLSEDDFTAAKWPDLKQFQYPDVYYNRNNSVETYEHDCIQIKQQVVVDETASICTNNNIQILRPQKKKSPRRQEQSTPLRRSPRNKDKGKDKNRRNPCQENEQTSGKIEKKDKKRVKKSILSEAGYSLSEKHKLKLRAAVYDVLLEHGISTNHALFQVCGGKLFNICRTFVKDVIKHGRTSEQMRRIANAHVKQVIEFEKQLDEFRKKVATP